MATSRYPQSDLRRQVGSPKPKIRGESTRMPLFQPQTLCRNVMIYGHCRYENTGCAFNHDQNRSNSVQNSPGGQSNQSDL
ncbi:hypothetical protein BDP81DRAFT_310591 [Colletotrichum phormii]|uniref:C3H1-type domain-containing protein n=1 Tax=Colletotrichum phormii TaxID=359342 RepID=A0AAI9ZZV9_9PEZI|nr:uncharacterized protein BDP81DRAFT_310591 [Colletotrichum phormii]KAK1641292.1 hypothetical protein BDP81DRAFT_310591 [Colletotrichum phormii]